MAYQNPLHPNIPEQYIYETNYRNIPSEYLEKNIPQGRGMIKWAPFATTPGLYNDIDEKINAQNNKDMPRLNEDQIMDINIKIHHYHLQQQVCIIKYYKDFNYHEVKCRIKKIFEYEQYILVELIDYKRDGNMLFSKIISITSI